MKIAMFGDREIIGSTPKNPVIMGTGGMIHDLIFFLKTPYGSREASGGHRKVSQNGTGFLRILF